MVCLGNICRSPLAHGILQHKVDAIELDWTIDSAGTGSWHVGQPPDNRSIEIGLKFGVDITNQKARQFIKSDFARFDKIYVMDSENYNNVVSLARSEEDKSKVGLILNLVNPGMNTAVPDPYYGGKQGFENVYDLLDQATDEIIRLFK